MRTGQISIAIDNDRAQIPSIIESIGRLAAQTGLGRELGYALELAVDELVTNTVSYGYPHGRAGRVEVALDVGEEAVTLTIVDDGVPYDPFCASTPPLAEPIETRAIGGLGVHLVREAMDSVRYWRIAGRNTAICVVSRRDQHTR